MFNNRKKKREGPEKGQGLVEYALILVLVAVVVIVIVSVLGEDIVKLFCKITLQIDSGIEAPICERIDVSCSGVSGGTVSGRMNLEAVVDDTKGADDVQRVVFSVDGVIHSQENTPKYCFGGGDTSCSGFNTRNLSNGTHTITATAYDAEGNTGTCEITITVSN